MKSPAPAPPTPAPPHRPVAIRLPLRATIGALVSGALLATWAGPGTALADRVEMADGRTLEGRFALVAGVAVDPIAEATSSRTAGTPVLMCDDELTRTFVSRRRVVRAEELPFGRQLQRIEIPQRVPENGRRVASIGGILAATPFDEFGRRILTLATASGRVDVVQGITEITPRWTRVQGVVTDNPLLLDMRLSTGSIPRDQLRLVLDRQTDPASSEERLRIVRLFLQAERYEEARGELDGVIGDFPALKNLAEERRSLGELSATRLLDEVRLRGRSGQDALAMEILERFPADDASAETIEAIREARDAYRGRQASAERLLGLLQERCDSLEDGGTRDAVAGILDEIGAEMTFATLDRLSAFERMGTEPDLASDRALAIALSGWLQGAAAAGENLKLALSAARVRDLLRDYLRADDAADRQALRERVADEEAGDAATIASLARQMRPPLDPPEPTAPGLHEFEFPGADGQPVTCLVQVPPEYDPLRRYPTVVSLHAAFTTPADQITWWAGSPAPDGRRVGQATRHGCIIVAPRWTEEGQSTYGYSAREHAAVLGSLREAQRRFAIDTDRVFLSGHSLGGDAAWDIALAHPDLWAGLVAITPGAGRYVNHYWHNARTLPIYVVGGELDNGTFARNGMDLDRYLAKGFDTTYVEYRGRGHEHFADEQPRIFDWMERRKRTFLPTTIDTVTMRPWDNFFWWVELSGAPPKTVVLPSQWPPGQGVRPFTLDAKTTATNGLIVHCGAERVRVWLSPDLVDFTRPVNVSLDGRKLWRDPVQPDEGVLLEDLRTRGDRQHPFWAVLESTRGPATAPSPSSRKAGKEGGAPR
jgi:pimeloyl-ACP methyl ester carboxylesterase